MRSQWSAETWTDDVTIRGASCRLAEAAKAKDRDIEPRNGSWNRRERVPVTGSRGGARRNSTDSTVKAKLGFPSATILGGFVAGDKGQGEKDDARIG